MLNDKTTQSTKPIKWYVKLATRKGRQETGAFLVEGSRAIGQIVASRPEAIIEVLTTDEASPHPEYPHRQITERQLRSIATTQTPQGIIAVVRLGPEIYTDRLPGNPGDRVLLLEDVQDPGNVGTIIRTAAAFDFSGIIMTENGADPFSPKCVQASAGATLSLWLRRTSRYRDLTQALRQDGRPLIATDLTGDTGPEILRQQQRFVLALGNEAAGLTPALCAAADYRMRLPTVARKAQSLNVAAAAAICMYLSAQNGAPA
jgi:TrmH family RNA methyltransferase